MWSDHPAELHVELLEDLLGMAWAEREGECCDGITEDIDRESCG